jgi:signal transduction histidine kinase
MISSADILKASILVVDDQEANVSLLEQMLHGAGYVSVTSTRNPLEVCDLHRKNRYSLILLDLLMPGMDGFQVMEGLKAIETGSYLPVLAQTAQPDHKLRALKAGAKDFISKPFDLAEVLLRVHNLIEVRLLHREVELRREQAEARSDQAEAANLAKSQFLANMSHELRTPLNAIIGFTEFLIDEKPGPLVPKQKEYLGDVLGSARHLLQLINDVLDLAKVEAGKMELNLETFPVRKAVEEVASVIKGIAQKKRIIIGLEIGTELEAVTLDQHKFKQMLYNLLSNAVKFSDNGGKVGIHARRVDPQRLEVQIRDAGIGIKAGDFKRLFTAFEQLDSGTARRFEGTGLGLALTKQIVEFQDGHISVESEPGQGSVFTVILPLKTIEKEKV